MFQVGRSTVGENKQQTDRKKATDRPKEGNRRQQIGHRRQQTGSLSESMADRINK